MTTNKFSKQVIRDVLDDIGELFPDNTVANVQDLLAHNEYGVALEVLCTQASEFEIPLSSANIMKLRTAAQMMGIEIDCVEIT